MSDKILVMTNDQVAMDAKIVWDYMLLHEPVVSAGLLLVLGSIDERVAVYAAELSRKYDYDTVLFTGGAAHADDLLRTTWNESEAEHFRDIFVKTGGRARHMLLETSAQNTGQNAVLSYELLVRNGNEVPATIQIVTKPYMERRARATFEAQWPDKEARFFVTSPRIEFGNYPDSRQSYDTLINIMVGDFERILTYPEHGLQTKQAVPDEAQDAWERLVAAGYIKHRMQ